MTEAAGTPGEGTVGEVFAAFLKLGLTSFGGPIAHLGYFRDELVTRRRWIDEEGYADLVAVAQFLPGPASSQVGFALGLWRGGLAGAAAAWTAFTLPSALALVLFAYATRLLTGPIAAGALHGLKLVAVAIVAQAVLGMAKNLAPDRPRAAIAVAAVFLVAAFGGSAGQIGAILAGAIAGAVLCHDPAAPTAAPKSFPLSRPLGAICLVTFLALLFGLPLLSPGTGATPLATVEAFYRAGALVFGGGHVVLPLLQSAVVGPGWLDSDTFLAGYGAAQAIPGPLFSFSAYLGTAIDAPGGPAGAALALVAIFLPGFLLLLGVLPFWDRLRARPGVQALMRGTNAAVVGILGAALYTPVFTSAVSSRLDLALALGAFVLLVVFRTPPWQVVVLAALSGMGLALFP